ncbi:hypothetical protein AGMMS50284_4490 [Clostridia bacterium]|nr:hypothetical protein AGMMS50284_4490 [Clostridia bacterium]
MLTEIIKYISAYQNIPVEKINAESHLIKDLGMSSLDMMQLVCAVEDHFRIEFDEDDLIDLLTVDKIASYIENKQVQEA